MKTLSELLISLSAYRAEGDTGVAIRRIRYDSRTIEPGDLFVAIPGRKSDGLGFVGQAITRGAAAIVAERNPGPLAVPVITVDDSHLALGELAAAFYDHPSHRMRVVGITGTDGKTSTTHILHSIFEAAGDRTGLSSTIRLVDSADRFNPSGLTTPDSVTVQEALASMVSHGCRRAVIEVSSHGLDQRRVDAVEFVAGVCTNVDPEHLDYHGTIDNYVAAKGRLFELVARSRQSGPKTIAVNADDVRSAGLPCPTGPRLLSFGLSAAAAVRAVDIAETSAGTAFRLLTPEGEIDIETRFVGRFNILNWLAAATVALGEGVALSAIQTAARSARPVSGRLELIAAGQPFRVVVDFAHTPQALGSALAALRPLTSGKLIVVFGHAGGRDPANRPRMGAAAAAYADQIVLTMDDPYGEDPETIVEAILPGIDDSQARPEVRIIIDRRDAIRQALTGAGPGDTVLIAGRGHETIIEWGTRIIPFSDQAVTRELLAEFGYRSEPANQSIQEAEAPPTAYNAP